MAVKIPARLTAGDSWSFALGTACPPPPDWSLSMVLAPAAGGTVLTLAASWNGSAWTAAATPDATAALTPGAITWSLVGETRIARITYGRGDLAVDPDPTSGADLRSDARRHLDAIEKVLADPAWIGAESYTIEGRSLARRPVADLMKLRAFFAAKVRAESGLSPFISRPARLAL